MKCPLHGRLHQLPVFSFNMNRFLLLRKLSLNIATSVEVHYSSEEVKVEGDFVGESGTTTGVTRGDALDLPLMWRVSLKLRDMEGDRANWFFYGRQQVNFSHAYLQILRITHLLPLLLIYNSADRKI